MLYIEMFFVLLLTLINGVLAMSELAIVSARRARLAHMAGRGNRGARLALELIDDPSRFLSTVQIGITLVGILAGAFGGATLANRLGDWLDGFAVIRPNGDVVAIGVVVVGITYLSLIVGELVPKRIALADPERLASIVAGPMNRLSYLAAPAVWLLKASIEPFIRLLGLTAAKDARVTEDEVKFLIAEGTRTGVFAPKEREMIEGVLRLADRSARAIMTPRSEIVWVDVSADRTAIVQTVETSRFSRLLVCDQSVDQAVGVVHAKDLLPVALGGEPFSLKPLMVPAPVVPERTPVLTLVERFRRNGVHMAVLVDEYGMTEGVVTLTDVLESIAGDLPERGEPIESLIVEREDGSWLLDGMLPIDEFEDRTGLRGLQADHEFQTMAGFVLQQLEHVPTPGESFVWQGVRFEVIDLDGRRIDKILVERQKHSEPELDQADTH